jgi:hypothetical protein
MAEPELCTFSDIFILPDGRPLHRTSATVGLAHDQGAEFRAGFRVDSHVTYYTQKDGSLSIPLVCGMRYWIRFSVNPTVRYEFTCPEEEEASLFDYIFPYITLVDFASPSFSLHVGQTISVPNKGFFSNGDVAIVSSAVHLADGPEDIIRVSGHTITGKVAGTTSIFIESVDDAKLPAYIDTMELPFLRKPTPYTIGTSRVVVVT